MPKDTGCGADWSGVARESVDKGTHRPRLAERDDYSALMLSTAWAIIGIAFAAFCVWLAVRIVNRRERWAKRIARWASRIS